MLSSRAAAAAALMSMTLAVTACGGSDTLSRGQLTSKANAICKDVEAKASALKQPSEQADAAAQIRYYDELSSTISDLTGRLKGLKPDDAAKSDWNALTSGIEQESDALKTLVAQGKKKDAAGVKKTSSDLDALDARTTAAAKKLGLASCGG